MKIYTFGAEDAPVPVSYTHLDVYKRQIYTVSSYLVTVPANLVKVMIIIGLLLFYANPSVALTALILIPLYMVPSFLNKSELERLLACLLYTSRCV